jgi:hypothetical protein
MRVRSVGVTNEIESPINVLLDGDNLCMYTTQFFVTPGQIRKVVYMRGIYR